MGATAFGLPTHALIIHATVVLLPLTTLLLVLAAFSARVRSRAGVVLPLAGVVCLVLVPLTTRSGEQLASRLPASAAIGAHERAAGALLPWTVALAVMSGVVWWSGRSDRLPRRAGSAVSIAVAVLATVAAAGTGIEVAHIGHLGAEAAWAGVAQLPPRS